MYIYICLFIYKIYTQSQQVFTRINCKVLCSPEWLVCVGPAPV